MSNASQGAAVKEVKDKDAWQDRHDRSEALNRAVSLVQPGKYDPKNIVKDAQVFYQFLKGTTK